MGFGSRVIAIAGAAAVALALAGSAPGRDSNHEPPAVLVVSAGDTSPSLASQTLVAALFSTDSAAPARVVFYVPQGYGLDLNRPNGTTIGEGLALLAATYSAGEVPRGALTTGDPARYVADPNAQACAPGAHAGVWVVSLPYGFGIGSLTLTFFVDPTSGDEAARGAFKIVVCLPSPDVPVGEGGSPAGPFLAIALDLEGILTNPAAGMHTWRLLVTPYVAGTAAPDPAKTFEARAQLPLPQTLTARAAYTAKSRTLKVSGRLLALEAPRARAVIVLRWASTPTGRQADFGTATTRADGTFTVRRRIAQTKRPQKRYLVAEVGVETGPCTDAPILSAGCASQSLSPPPSRSLVATIPKLQPKKRP